MHTALAALAASIKDLWVRFAGCLCSLLAMLHEVCQQQLSAPTSQRCSRNSRHAAGTLPEDCPEHPLLRQFVRLLPSPGADFPEVLYVFQRHGFREDWQVRLVSDAAHTVCCRIFHGAPLWLALHGAPASSLLAVNWLGSFSSKAPGLTWSGGLALLLVAKQG